MFDLNRPYNRPKDRPILRTNSDQTCTFQCLNQQLTYQKYNRCGHESPSGYGTLVVYKKYMVNML